MRLVVACLGAALLAGCAHMRDANSADDGARSLAGTHWSIASINGAAPTAARKAIIDFTTDRVSGNAGCNSFGAGYVLVDGVLTAAQMISTRMACPGPGMDQEQAAFKILAEPMTVTWHDDGRLMLSDDAGTMTLKPE